MATPNNEPGLYLHIKSEPWEKVCDVCKGSGRHPAGGKWSICEVCRGTRKRRVRLTGMVAVEIGHDGYNGEPIWFDLDSKYQCYETPDNLDAEELIAWLIKEYRADTLPAAVRDGLHQEDCD